MCGCGCGLIYQRAVHVDAGWIAHTPQGLVVRPTREALQAEVAKLFGVYPRQVILTTLEK